MADKDQVIAALEIRNKVLRGAKFHDGIGCTVNTSPDSTEDCPYFNDDCKNIYKDIIAVLEPLPVERYDKVMKIGACPRCLRTLSKFMRFCPVCGQEVVWDDRDAVGQDAPDDRGDLG